MNALGLVLDPGKAVILRRVSSAEQAEGYGLESQLRDCRKFAAAEGLEIVADYAETARSTTLLDEREGGAAALKAMLENGAGTLLLARRDRLARDPYVAGDAKRAVAMMGGRIAYAEGGNGDDDAALFIDDIQHAVSALERRAIVARLAKGRAAKAAAHPGSRAQGGKVPYGYRRTATGLEIDAEQAAVVREVFALVKGGASLAKAGAAVGLSASTVQGIVGREVYKQTDGRIVDPRIWNAAQKALESRKRR